MTAKRWTADHKLCARHSEDASASEGGVLLARLRNGEGRGDLSSIWDGGQQLQEVWRLLIEGRREGPAKRHASCKGRTMSESKPWVRQCLSCGFE